MIRQLVPVVLVSAGAFAAALSEAEGDLTWGGREEHPAVVNPVLGNEAGSVISLRGEWEFSPAAANLGRNGIWKPFYKERHWQRWQNREYRPLLYQTRCDPFPEIPRKCRSGDKM